MYNTESPSSIPTGHWETSPFGMDGNEQGSVEMRLHAVTLSEDAIGRI